MRMTERTEASGKQSAHRNSGIMVEAHLRTMQSRKRTVRPDGPPVADAFDTERIATSSKYDKTALAVVNARGYDASDVNGYANVDVL